MVELCHPQKEDGHAQQGMHDLNESICIMLISSKGTHVKARNPGQPGIICGFYYIDAERRNLFFSVHACLVQKP